MILKRKNEVKLIEEVDGYYVETIKGESYKFYGIEEAEQKYKEIKVK